MSYTEDELSKLKGVLMRAKATMGEWDSVARAALHWRDETRPLPAPQPQADTQTARTRLADALAISRQTEFHDDYAPDAWDQLQKAADDLLSEASVTQPQAENKSARARLADALSISRQTKFHEDFAPDAWEQLESAAEALLSESSVPKPQAEPVIGPRETVARKLTCDGCPKLKTEHWKDHLDNDETDIGLRATCEASNRSIDEYWHEGDATPSWCPHLPNLAAAPQPHPQAAPSWLDEVLSAATPGEWNVMESKRSGLFHVEVDGTGAPICSVSTGKANALAIAAAVNHLRGTLRTPAVEPHPEKETGVLEALEECIRVLGAHANDESPQGWDAIHAIEKARAASAAIRGLHRV